MTMLTIVSVLVGALLGIRFKVFILLPAVLLAVAVVTAVGLSRESGVWWIALEIVVIMTALELGYLGGSLAARIGRGRARLGVPVKRANPTTIQLKIRRANLGFSEFAKIPGKSINNVVVGSLARDARRSAEAADIYGRGLDLLAIGHRGMQLRQYRQIF